jgi:hypothetical protein
MLVTSHPTLLTIFFPLLVLDLYLLLIEKVRITFLYYESIKWELKTRPTNECRYDERLKTKTEESTRLGYTGLVGELENLKMKTRLIDEKFPSVMGEYVFLKSILCLLWNETTRVKGKKWQSLSKYCCLLWIEKTKLNLSFSRLFSTE